jgi:8-oxo-dGTP pyrophosphatase MutT (NUDIX family)
MTGRLVRPVDAAGLVLLRQGAAGLEVLLGRRHARAGFLPDIYVFPGGRVERQDSLGEDLAMAPAVAAALGRASRRRPGAFLRAALRETAEETGLSLPEAAVARIDFVCRAITPTRSHRRYNTRFFLADGAECRGSLAGDGELEDLAWRPVEETDRLKLVDVTAFVLAEAVRRRNAGLAPGAAPPARFSYVGPRLCIVGATAPPRP